jgi:multicomponent Na+:H+ antiporter subunit G
VSAALHGLTAALLFAGAAFFAAGSVGLLRLPDVFSRLHAVTKADNLGLGLTLLGLSLQAEDASTLVRLGLAWLLVLGGSTVSCFLIAGAARRAGLAGGKDDS